MADGEVDLQPIPGVALRVRGDPAALGHFSAEYGDAPPTPSASNASLELRFVRRLQNARWDRHKSVAWRARLSPTEDGGLLLEIDLRGVPRWFGLSLVQGYLVEPVLSLLAAEGNQVLLPAAAIGPPDAVTVLIGRSRTGKSSLSLRALAAGVPILGDDQVVINGDGRVVRFPRRLRVYDDLRLTAPAAVERLPASFRRSLVLRRLVRVATGGAVAPSMAIPADAFRVPLLDAGQIGRVVLLRRDDEGTHEPMLTPASGGEAVDAAADALAAQRHRMRKALGHALESRLNTAAPAEDAVLRPAFASAKIASLVIPGELAAEVAISAVADLLGCP